MVIPKALAPKELVKVFESRERIVLPPWDPMVGFLWVTLLFNHVRHAHLSFVGFSCMIFLMNQVLSFDNVTTLSSYASRLFDSDIIENSRRDRSMHRT